MNITKQELEAVRGARRDVWEKAFDALWDGAKKEYTHAELVAVLMLRAEKPEPEPVPAWST